ncbi:hypothetical protein E2C01_067467 [Portunus trituberculatus]|uniref:Secreted protein n=1 Tax=Portunus trituberculatus TaxID=210409 RepID=A0A5B7HTQ3_PORTR|nr:hypothetical protein [Portunus trituberculatus]
MTTKVPHRHSLAVILLHFSNIACAPPPGPVGNHRRRWTVPRGKYFATSSPGGESWGFLTLTKDV